ncbi:hypothetical protein BRC2024_KCUCJSVR_CDS_0114 [Acinetobacter phage vB_AbaM_KissB]|uniref:hypothetical protein n=1 Tax=Acinetobacter phage vB_AbaM_phiAbaA1 TaxID=1605379 RepID=UPI00078C881A|nr:hypothetical protein BJD49_gp117 [Acinetobacter phage vB_AbaM_phiAbaA1]AJK27173.1 hypothetical protein phiAbaA1_070 [Acinetobacter phage vB_AbaM_phiAbaA1]
MKKLQLLVDIAESSDNMVAMKGNVDTATKLPSSHITLQEAHQIMERFEASWENYFPKPSNAIFRVV